MLYLLGQVSIVAVIVYGLVRRYRGNPLPLPPGMKRMPILGNLLQLPTRAVWRTYDSWSKDLDSDIIHVDIVGNSLIILNSEQAAIDLLDKRSAIYSCRPRMPMATELMGWESIFLFMPYGERWRSHRRLFDSEFNSHAAKKFQPQEVKAARHLLKNLLETPDKFAGHIRNMAGQVIMSITYGLDVQPENDPYLTVSEKALKVLSKASFPGRFMIDFIPSLKYVPSWFPGAEFKRQAKIWKGWTDEMIDAPFDVTKQNIVNGTAVPSFTRRCLENINLAKDVAEQEALIKNTAGTMYAGGNDTTVSAITFFFLAILANPEAQRKAQEEIDRVVPSGYLPEFHDEDSLPYVTALVKEVFRWGNVAPIAPHVSVTEDVYRGYRIPARSLVVANLWAILHDEDMYPDSETFKPERFLLPNGQLNPSIRDPRNVVFGFGRRICPGRHMAYSSVWITIASILATLDINKALDENKEVITPKHEFSAGIVCAPRPFKCSITPRSNASEMLIHSAFDTDKQ